jgi:hypothetical protein
MYEDSKTGIHKGTKDLDRFRPPIENNNLARDLFHLPMSYELVNHASDSTDQDAWTYSWESSYSVAKACDFFMQLKHPSERRSAFRWLWRSCYQEKDKSFLFALAPGSASENKKNLL